MSLHPVSKATAPLPIVSLACEAAQRLGASGMRPSKEASTREPFVPFNASGPAAKPMMEVMGACKAGGVWPFAHFNRLQVTPPCTTSDAEALEGLAAIDKALDVADKYYTGK